MRRRGGGGLASAQVNDVARDGNRNDVVRGRRRRRLGRASARHRGRHAGAGGVEERGGEPGAAFEHDQVPGPSSASRRAATWPEPGLGVLS
jgi:hypothetical protein